MRRIVIAGVITILLISGLQFGLTLATGSRLGADDRAKNEIAAGNEGYRPWFAPVFSTSKTTQSVMFGVQTLIGAGLIFAYVVHVRRRRDADVATADGAHPIDEDPSCG